MRVTFACFGHHSHMRKWMFPLCLSLLCGGDISGQDIRPTDLTDQVVQQVVDRILRYKIKPGRKPRTVYLNGTSFVVRDAETPVVQIPIQPKWLPRIKNIEFKIHSKNDPADAKGYHFSEIEKANGRYEIS